ncbi:MAG: hypothetical protein QG608_2301 [Actinomycetota bacterium]|nr:hypothetical protein [Actinomycetota bacterium]
MSETPVPHIPSVIGPITRSGLVTVAAALLLTGCGATSGADYSNPLANPVGQKSEAKGLRCVGLITERRDSRIPGMVMDRYTAVIEGGAPDHPRTLSKVTYSARPKKIFHLTNDGLTAIVTHDQTWKITSLEIEISNNQLVVPTGVTKCPNRIIDRK